jgi:hypothetical protein
LETPPKEKGEKQPKNSIHNLILLKLHWIKSGLVSKKINLEQSKFHLNLNEPTDTQIHMKCNEYIIKLHECTNLTHLSELVKS